MKKTKMGNLLATISKDSEDHEPFETLSLDRNSAKGKDKQVPMTEEHIIDAVIRQWMNQMIKIPARDILRLTPELIRKATYAV